MDLLLVSRDLMLSSRIEGVARNLGYEVSHAGDITEAISALNEYNDCKIVFLDLQLPSLDVPLLVEETRKLKGSEKVIVACGPHVHEQRLNEARQAGCDRVVSKGQFDRDAEAILTV